MTRSTSSRPNTFISLVAWLLPHTPIKVWLLRRLGHTISDTARIGPNLVLGCGTFTVGAGSIVSPFNVFRSASRIEIGDGVFIGRLNQVTAAPAYQEFSDRCGVLVMGDESIITNRHYFDVSGRIELDRRAGIGGIRTVMQSHEIDIVANETTVGIVRIGENAMLATACLVLKDARVPAYSIVAAGSTVTAARPDEELPQGLYAGSPARWRKDLPDCSWWHRDGFFTPVREVRDL
ncbi:hypothetical protein JVX90_14800 [Gordonia sp. PDNC005]|uniref:acyltransferase n=1 Tax=unclassified Gordonia (in: high G+C Gram-positive bacteria) TaxID=2657482 RepID=UPI0019627792|nr:hypothetical protein [Gordonia sp. PDNC005]QRY61674.1 hypothetical protein JVX90_14800 [Gordonia sp. PDNC005]